MVTPSYCTSPVVCIIKVNPATSLAHVSCHSSLLICLVFPAVVGIVVVDDGDYDAAADAVDDDDDHDDDDDYASAANDDGVVVVVVV